MEDKLGKLDIVVVDHINLIDNVHYNMKNINQLSLLYKLTKDLSRIQTRKEKIKRILDS